MLRDSISHCPTEQNWNGQSSKWPDYPPNFPWNLIRRQHLLFTISVVMRRNFPAKIGLLGSVYQLNFLKCRNLQGSYKNRTMWLNLMATARWSHAFNLYSPMKFNLYSPMKYELHSHGWCWINRPEWSRKMYANGFSWLMFQFPISASMCKSKLKVVRSDDVNGGLGRWDQRRAPLVKRRENILQISFEWS